MSTRFGYSLRVILSRLRRPGVIRYGLLLLGPLLLALIGAYYALVFNYANLDDFPVRERGRASAAILVDALAPRPEESHGPT